MRLYDRTEWTYRRPADAEADRTPWLEAVRKLNRSVRDRPTDHRPSRHHTNGAPSGHYPHSPAPRPRRNIIGLLHGLGDRGSREATVLDRALMCSDVL